MDENQCPEYWLTIARAYKKKTKLQQFRAYLWKIWYKCINYK